MIKFFQKLKAKKGFTLVELIVVIAIIGVLAAILVPTMLGYVTSSRVTSANSTAASIKNNIDTFLTNADTAGYGMKLSSDATATLTITVTGGEWSVSVGGSAAFGEGGSTNDGDKAFKSKTGVGEWSTTTATTVKDGNKTQAGGQAPAILAYELKALFPDIDTAAIRVYLQGGKAKYCWYTADTNDDTGVFKTAPNVDDDFSSETFAWDGNTAGVSDNGYIVGTAPALAIKTAASK